MSEPKFTPGPWQINGSHIYTEDPKRAVIAQVFNPGKSADAYPLIENAHLIAAAPELYEALEYCIKQIPEFGDVPGIKAALAKVRGES